MCGGTLTVTNSPATKIAVLSHLAILCALDDEGGVVCRAEFRGVSVVDGEGDGFAAKPVAYVVYVL